MEIAGKEERRDGKTAFALKAQAYRLTAIQNTDLPPLLGSCQKN